MLNFLLPILLTINLTDTTKVNVQVNNVQHIQKIGDFWDKIEKIQRESWIEIGRTKEKITNIQNNLEQCQKDFERIKQAIDNLPDVTLDEEK